MSFSPIRFAAAIVAISLVGTLSGCAGAGKASQGPVFFPGAPNLPRLQYLAGVSSSSDVEGSTDSVSFFNYGRATASKKPRPIVKPYGITTSNGKVYLADLVGQIIIIDLPKKTFEYLKGNTGFGKLKKPVDVAVDEIGFVYVADVGRKEVVVYDQEGEFLKTMGGDFGIAPTGVALDGERLYILDTKGGVIKVLDRVTGEFIMDIGQNFEGANKLNMPINFTLDKKGVFHITNAGNGKIVSCDRDGNVLGTFGQIGDGFGQFTRPKGIAVSDAGEVFVVDAGVSNAQIFNDKGRLLTYFGSNKIPVGGMNLPTGITLSSSDLEYYQSLAEKNFQVEQVVFVANQFGDPRIGIYGFGKLRGVDYDKEYRKLQDEREKKARIAMEKAQKDAKAKEAARLASEKAEAEKATAEKALADKPAAEKAATP